MCDFSQGFILCTCNDPKARTHNRQSRRNKGKQEIEYTWTLDRHIGALESPEMGRYLFPVSDIGQGLTQGFVLQALNKGHCFDFAYTPEEGDNLVLAKAGKAERLEFIFRQGAWVSDHYSPLEENTQTFLKGKLTAKKQA